MSTPRTCPCGHTCRATALDGLEWFPPAATPDHITVRTDDLDVMLAGCPYAHWDTDLWNAWHASAGRLRAALTAQDPEDADRFPVVTDEEHHEHEEPKN